MKMLFTSYDGRPGAGVRSHGGARRCADRQKRHELKRASGRGWTPSNSRSRTVRSSARHAGVRRIFSPFGERICVHVIGVMSYRDSARAHTVDDGCGTNKLES